jgi:type VI secretion system FHA domain protein
VTTAPTGQPSIQAVEAELAAFLIGAGLQPSDLKVSGAQAMTAAGSALRRVIAGLVVMLEARARAKAQLGAQGTSLEFDGNNPLKFARAPEKAIAQLLNPPERGFMSADRAVDDAFRDLQAHQMATLTAMQGALAATLARFSPQAIRDRAESQGFLAKLLPGGREATLWQAYEREFEGVARGSDEAFMDVFAKEFKQAYERASADVKRKT